MKSLVDTHVILWFTAGDERLPTKYRKLLEQSSRELSFSAVSAVEISTKFVRGKLRLPGVPSVYIPQVISDLRLVPLAITMEHATGVSHLPLHHADPFDRLLIAQARSENLPIITSDKAFRRYDVDVIW